MLKDKCFKKRLGIKKASDWVELLLLNLFIEIFSEAAIKMP